MRPASLPLALVLVVLATSAVVAATWVFGGPESGAPSTIEAPRAQASPDGVDVLEPQLVDVEPARGARRAIEPPTVFAMPALERVELAATKLAPHGTLVVAAIDADTGAAIGAPRVRAASSTRYAERVADADVEATRLRLTPGDYALYVGFPGYEPAWVGAARVISTQKTELAPVRLRRGTGRVLGRVAGEIGDDLAVELRGEGRPYCAECGDDECASCGRAEDRTRRALGPTGEFEFEHLPSGVYLVRLVDAHRREASPPVRVHLAAGETRDVAVRVARSRTVVVALDDVDGAPLDRPWSRRLAREIQGRVAGRTVSAPTWSARFLDGEVLVAEGEFVAPDPDGLAQRWWSVGMGCTSGGHGARHDRERGTDDVLQPSTSTPWIDAACVEPEIEHDGRVRFDHVPARASEIALSCAHFRASAGLGGKGTVTRRVRLARDPSVEGGAATFAAFETELYE